MPTPSIENFPAPPGNRVRRNFTEELKSCLQKPECALIAKLAMDVQNGSYSKSLPVITARWREISKG
jgi:hypothetical protein